MSRARIELGELTGDRLLVERTAAAMWRVMNPTKNSFDCSADEKDGFRAFAAAALAEVERSRP